MPHVFSNVCTALLNLIQWESGEKKCRPIINHDGTKHLAPDAGSLRFDREQVPFFLTDCLDDVFTLEPQGKVLRYATGEAITMQLEYELGIAPKK